MPEKPGIAVVILNWNGISLLREFLPGVLHHTPQEKAEIYVADNGSTDESTAWLRENHPRVKVIELKQNHGFSKGYNLALQQIDARYYVLINSDIEVTPNWLDPCIRRLEEDQEVAAVQPKILSHTKRSEFEYAGAAGGYIDRWGYPFCRGRILYVTEKDNGQYDQPVSVLWATGACLFIRSDAFHKAGGFDDDFFAHMEEIDLCWRLKNQGWKIGVEPAATVYHLGGATLSYQSPRKVYLNFRNNLWMLMKNLPSGRLAAVMLVRMILDGVAAIHFLLTGKTEAFVAVWKAHMAFYSTLGRFLGKRRELLKKAVKRNHPEIFRGSMVYRFYIRKQKKFPGFNFHPPLLP